jgi:uncharacterized protein (UPF0548 family)
MFPPHFARLFWPGPILPGKLVAVRFRAMGLWSLNACRVVYTFDDRDAGVEQYGFAYGTLSHHVEQGEERFCVQYDHRDETVWYEIYCFSKARHWLAKLAYPYVRLIQARFRHLSAASMKSVVSQSAVSVSGPPARAFQFRVSRPRM